MTDRLVLASASPTRAGLLERAGLAVRIHPAGIDEAALRDSLAAEGAAPRDIADALAEAKARKVAGKVPAALVIGADQILALEGGILSKPPDRAGAAAQLRALSGRTHELYSAAVICEGGAPVWRHVTRARLTMRGLSDDFVEAYLDRNWPDVAGSVGAYRIEEEGARLMARIEGDHFAILGLPLVELLSYLALRGEIEG